MSHQAIVDPYYSRTQDRWEAVDRQDPVVWSDGIAEGLTYALSAGEIRKYERDGFHHAATLISQREAAELLAEAERLSAEAVAAGPRAGPRAGIVLEPENNAVRSLFRVHRQNGRFRAIAEDPRLVDVARQLLGSEVYIHQSRINFKPAFDGKEFFWHSDFETWHVEDGMPRMRAVSVSISLTDNNEFNGPLMVVPGSHRSYIRCMGATPVDHFEQSLKQQEYGVPSREAMRQLVDRGGITAPKGPPGSALFFDCNLMHGSAGNLSPDQRTNLFLVYNSVENAIVEPYGDQPPRPEFLAERAATPIEY